MPINRALILKQVNLKKGGVSSMARQGRKLNLLNWKEEYQKKLVTAAEAAKIVKSGDRINAACALTEPPGFMRALAARAHDLKDVWIDSLTVRPYDYLKPEFDGKLIMSNWYPVFGKDAIMERRAFGNPFHFHDLAKYYRECMNIDIAAAMVSEPDEWGYCSLGPGVGDALTAKDVAKVVILEVNKNSPYAYGNNLIHISEADYIIENDEPLLVFPWPEATPEDEAIGNYVAELVEDGSCLQIGLGGISNVCALALKGKKDLGVHTEQFVDNFIDLIESGAITNERKNINKGKSIAMFVFGSKRAYDFINRNPSIEMHPCSYTNNPFIASQNDKLIAINNCMEMDLTGQACSESIGPLPYSGTGGQVDFCRAAWESNGGKSFLVFYSTAKRFKPKLQREVLLHEPYVKHGDIVSKIQPWLTPGAVVTTPRTDVSYVVTEYGVAYLRGKSTSARAKELIRIAHPDFRDELEFNAKKVYR
jgi:acyl-CoA hydrolase